MRPLPRLAWAPVSRCKEARFRLREVGLCIAANTVSRFENGSGARPETLKVIQEVLEKAGVVFIAPDGRNGPGVRIKPG